VLRSIILLQPQFDTSVAKDSNSPSAPSS